MKVLVADDDALMRRLLIALLNKLGHEVEAVEDGHAALKTLESPTPPAIALLDWMIPGVNGVEVCKHLRAHPGKSRPYVLLLSAKSDKQDVIAGLDAGADDFLVKPFDPMALLARIRVAQRIIAYQQELQQNIATMESLLRRNNLLGELVGKQGRGTEAPAPAVASPSPASARPASSSPGKALPASPLLAPEAMNRMLVRSLAEVGLGTAQVTTVAQAPATQERTFTAWAPLVMIREFLWVDLLFEANDTSAVAMFESLLGRIPVSEREQVDFLAETFNLICTAIKTALTEQGAAVLAPVISRSIRTASLNIRPPSTANISRHQITTPQLAAHLTVLRQAAPVLAKSLGQLHEMDILAENLPSPSTTEVFLLNQGVVLNERYIEKLTSLAKAESKSLRVPVFEPSRLTEFFCLGRISGG
jgi:CheY-like chemotaxis protein